MKKLDFTNDSATSGHVDLLFLPQHDPAFPHSALPHIKSYITEKFPSLVVRCIDLNIQMYREHIIGDNYIDFIKGFRDKFFAETSEKDALEVALDFENELAKKCNSWLNDWDDYKITLRNFDAPYDRNNVQDIDNFSKSKTPFDDLFKNYINNLNSRVIGINLSVEDQVLPTVRFIRLCKESNPDVIIVLGGSYLSRVYPVIKDALSYFYDYMVIREGEDAFCDVLDYIYFNGNKSKIINNGKIIIKDKPPISVYREFNQDGITHIQNITDSRQCFDDYDVKQYLSLEPMLPILASRKCYWGNCKFCTIHESWDPKKRIRSADDILLEIKDYMKRYGISNFRFVDEAIPPNLIFEFSNLLIENKIKIGFEAYAIAEKRFNKKASVSLLGKAGCRQLYIGIESVGKDALVSMKKHINDTDNLDVILKLFADNGIHVYAFILFGYPNVSEQDNRKTIDFVKNNMDIHTIGLGSYVPVLGSPHVNENKELYSHNGGLTEDLQSNAPHLDDGKSIANNALTEIIQHRTDLEKTILLSDESRYALTGKFGPNFAQNINGEFFPSKAIKKAVRERISRGDHDI